MSDELRPLPELVSFIELAPEPHILFDRDYRVIAANKAYRAQYGGGRSVVGRTCYDVSHHYSVPCDRAGEACPLARSLESEQRERVLHLHQTPRGEEYVNIELTPVRNGSGDIAWFIEKMEPLKVARGVSERSGLIGRAPAFQRMLELVARVAPSDASVLLQGESGSGKELVAQAVHDASRRADRPFVAVDCSGLQDTLFESELFGHEKGAFTGAIARKAGLVEAASGGTLFLDELGDIPLTMQVKLLRLLETGTYRRVGSTELMRADVRLVSATHRPLKQMIAEGRFRQDLYYRLNAFPIVVPPLRERREDLPLLVESLLARVAPGRRLTVAPAAMRALQAYAFPGNVRELRNVLERASLLCDGEEIGTQHLDEEICIGCAGPARSDAADGLPADGGGAVDLEEAQRQMLARVVHNHTGSRHELARKLGISERTLYRRLRALGIAQD
ncbi:sigma-54-dependent Fis family transcriptional regulator [Methyloversatilis sp. XJ19-49]|uniref:sigma-54 interaction domain-containing protein n=1 Tax=Methyloversatilis sp. XJ19-49 TaxID=2963429 RepID=UPI00211BA8BF|nr:sigma-54-dependent Fis family transcriptional regulator [Methyloversatilis sp. XJ19-49]MCQ9377298.1 sigma-54-dependent Fis family transcriptional regulator [Methyloversatilis sp. XJ19-49]